ncbi:hypothetical protein ACN28G_21175 [Micromonospora sp. WMMA1923]|uniref:hypothetical protein n=1 Tax=Micromonospora sp. WMMA1923 TaxID=3404125 RepID=UPI003B964596
MVGEPVTGTSADFVTYAAWMREVPKAQWRRMVEDAMEMVDLADQRRMRIRQRLQFRKIISGLGETVVVLSTHLSNNCERALATRS